MSEVRNKLCLTISLDSSDYRQCEQLAHEAEIALFHAIVVSEKSGLKLENRDRSSAVALEPFSLLAALSASTMSIGLIAEVHAAYNEPYHIARKLASLDYISGGRAGCHIVAGPEDAARNFDRADKRGIYPRSYEAAAVTEFVEALKQLWDSWDDEALVYDKRAGTQINPGKVREIDYIGRHYAVKGPLNIARPPQGHPPVIYTLSDENSRFYAAKEADMVISSLRSLEEAALLYADMRVRMERNGRAKGECLIMAELSPLVADTAREARELERTLQEESSAKAANRSALAGTAMEIADWIETRFRCGAADGFHIMQPACQDHFARFTRHVIPELQNRGLFRACNKEAILRANLGLARPENVFSTLR